MTTPARWRAVLCAGNRRGFKRALGTTIFSVAIGNSSLPAVVAGAVDRRYAAPLWSSRPNRSGRGRALILGCHKIPLLCSRCWPSLQEAGNFKIKLSGRCRDAIFAGGELLYLGRHDFEDRRKSVRSVLDRLSQTLVICCDPIRQLLGYSVAHRFRESERFFCARVPMRGRNTVHDATPLLPITRTSQASSSETSMFVPKRYVDVLWISFFSAREINNLRRGHSWPTNEFQSLARVETTQAMRLLRRMFVPWWKQALRVCQQAKHPITANRSQARSPLFLPV
jgi:hypothetical protein